MNATITMIPLARLTLLLVLALPITLNLHLGSFVHR